MFFTLIDGREIFIVIMHVMTIRKMAFGSYEIQMTTGLLYQVKGDMDDLYDALETPVVRPKPQT